MIAQLPLSFRIKSATRLEDFVPGDNSQAVYSLKSLLSDTGERQIYLSGAAGSGKSHLLLGLVESADRRGLNAAYLPLRELVAYATDVLDGLASLDLLAIDDLEALCGNSAWQEAVFVLFNLAREQSTRLAFTANQGPAALPLELEDLKSRLAWGTSYTLQPLNDEYKMDLLVMQANKRGLILKQDAAQYLLTRCKRDTQALLSTLDKLDKASLAAQRKLTLPFVRDQLLSFRSDNP